jgi:hypothetical protein
MLLNVTIQIDVPDDGVVDGYDWLANVGDEAELDEGASRYMARAIAQGEVEPTMCRVEVAREPARECPVQAFEVLWYSGGEHSHAPNRVIGRDMIERPDMPAALRAACNMLVDGGGAGEGMAKGFYVRKVNA